MARVSILAMMLVAALAGLQLARAQSAGELLQKAIYAQESVGDFDGAMKIYRQVASSAGTARPCAAQAEYRIAQCLTEKGAKSDAAMAFRKFLDDYADQKELVDKARESLRKLAAFMPVEYHDAGTGFSFTAPPGEWFEYTEARRNDGSVTINFNQSGPWGWAKIYVKSRKVPAAELAQHLQEDLDSRIQWGPRSTDYNDYLLRPESLSSRQVGRFQVLSAVLDSPRGENGRVASFYLVWVASVQTEASFEAITNQEYLDRVRHDFDRIVETVKMP